MAAGYENRNPTVQQHFAATGVCVGRKEQEEAFSFPPKQELKCKIVVG